ncbi:MAG TPA: hypothetical protein VKR06_11215 [Ktedonosporobacter sp.]|nr:hypothetical protein [Ktedonosporobacter sp.]
MSKIKMRCITCGKWFQSANAKEVTCPDCTQKARKEKLAAKQTPPVSNKPAGSGPNLSNPIRPPAPPKPKSVQSGTSHWLDTLDDVKVGQPDQPAPRPKLPPAPPAPRDTRSAPGGFRNPNSTGGPGQYHDTNTPAAPESGRRGPGAYREQDYRGPGAYREQDYRGPGSYREQDYRGPGSYRPAGPGPSNTLGQHPRPPIEGVPGRGPRPDRPPRPGGPRDGAQGAPRPKFNKPKTPKPAAPPKPKREKIPPPPPFEPTPEQIAQVEARYTELATPSEFDGIRTQIAKELTIPKKAVKKIIKDLRDRQHIPSWWEIQTYKGSQEELDKIKAAYEPLLPVPAVGVHKTIAEQLSLKPGTVYQAIKAIRLELNLPQYNDPTLHEGEQTGQPSAAQPTTEQPSGEAAPAESAPAPIAEPAQPPVAETTSANSQADNQQATE